MVGRFNRAILRFRVPILVLLLLLTAFMAQRAGSVRFESRGTDLFPANHPYVATFHKYSDVFGNANRVAVMVEVKQGTIFSIAALQKIQNVTRALERVPGMNQNQLVSIASRKARIFGMRSTGMYSERVMWPNVPRTDAEAAAVRTKVLTSGYLYGTLVSLDEKAALVAAEFYDAGFDARRVYQQLEAIRAREQDDNISLHLIGRPMLVGGVMAAAPRLAVVMALSAAFMLIGLWFCFRNLGAVLAPVAAASMSAVMGFGFVGLTGGTFDPLCLVVPFVITARALSHSAQMVSRFQQELGHTQDRLEAVRRSAEALFKPSLFAIISDAVGVLLIFIVPIPLLQKLALMGAFWLTSIFLSGMVLTPILLSLIPVGVRAPNTGSTSLDTLLTRVVRGCTGAWRKPLIVGVVVVMALCGALVQRVTVGDVHHGAALLWPDSIYNLDTASIARRFANTEQLTVVVEGADEHALKTAAVLQPTEAFQRHMESLPEVGATVSIGDLLPKMVAVFHGEDPKLNLIPDRQDQLNFFVRLLYTSGDRGDRDRYITPNHRSACITIFLQDHKGETLRKVIAHARRFIDGHPMQGAHFRLAGGYGGLLAAINEDLTRFDARISAAVFGAVFLGCAIAFRSLLAGLLLLLPLLVSNYLTYALMGALNIGLDVNVLPVVALGISLGVDYSLYVVQAIKDEVPKHATLELAIVEGVRSAGKGVLMAALTMSLGLVFWRFSFLRFQAEMGMLLLFWLSVSMLGALVLIPALLAQLKPRFLRAG
jgi:predicted RND superfamily exporter protein